MGGFAVLCRRTKEEFAAWHDAQTRLFSQMGLPRPLVVQDEDYTLLAFPKRQEAEPAFAQFPNGDFVFTCGTLFYGGTVGKAAALEFYRDYDGSAQPSDRARGHYAVILRKGGRTQIVPDSFGGYHVFCDAGMRIASSSFLVVASTLNLLTLSAQSVYEYVFNGVVSGNQTLFEEVIVAPVNSTIMIAGAGLSISRRPTPLPLAFAGIPFEQMRSRSMTLLDDYFSAVAKNFGDRVTLALSGGYDSRLILAMLRRHGVRPRLYVYGSPGDKDLTVGKAAAEGEGFVLETIDKESGPVPKPDEFAAVARQNFFESDGYTWDGIFHNGAERVQRRYRVEGNSLALNGGGGEIWRNFFYLLNRSYRPREILWAFYSQFDPRSCTEIFDEQEYFYRLEAKLEELMRQRYSRLARPLVEWLYHNFRCRSWDGRMNTINSSFGHTALPFLERPLTEHAATIPIGWKLHGAYEAELLRRIDRRLAAYPSAYGHSFAGPPPLGRRLADYATYLRPPWVRRFSYRIKHRGVRDGAWPRYLEAPYRDAVLPGGAQAMAAFFRLERVTDPQQMARILTLEYIVREFDGRLRFDLTVPNRRCAG